MGAAPQIIDRYPGGSVTKKRHCRFSIYEEDVNNPAHVGRIALDTLNISVDYGDGRGQRALISAGEVVDAERTVLYDLGGSWTGMFATGCYPTGRHLQTLRMQHTFGIRVPDGRRVTYYVTVEDAAGNQLDTSLYFDTWQWTATVMPKLEFYKSDNNAPVESLVFWFHPLGTEQEKTFNLWWGKGIAGDLALDAVQLQVTVGSINRTGKEFIEGGYLTINGQTVGSSIITLNGMAMDESQAITVGLDTEAQAASRGKVLMELTVMPVLGAKTGLGMTGMETTGGCAYIADRFGKPNNYTLMVNCIDSALAAYWESCGLEWQES